MSGGQPKNPPHQTKSRRTQPPNHVTQSKVSKRPSVVCATHELISKMKRGAYLVNTARGKICDRDAVAGALESGQLAGYAGDVWFPQPAPKDHPWRTMPHHGMTPHTSGTSLSAQARYAAGTREILECWFEGKPIREEYLIVDRGTLAGGRPPSLSRRGPPPRPPAPTRPHAPPP